MRKSITVYQRKDWKSEYSSKLLHYLSVSPFLHCIGGRENQSVKGRKHRGKEFIRVYKRKDWKSEDSNKLLHNHFGSPSVQQYLEGRKEPCNVIKGKQRKFTREKAEKVKTAVNPCITLVHLLSQQCLVARRELSSVWKMKHKKNRSPLTFTRTITERVRMTVNSCIIYLVHLSFSMSYWR